MSTFTIQQQIAECAREAALRRAFYPKFIASDRLTQEKADFQIACMDAVIETLKAVRDNPAALMRDDGK